MLLNCTFGKSVCRLLLSGFLILAIVPCQAMAQDYDSPGTGVVWTLDDLVANSGGAVTGQSPNYMINGDVAITATDTLTIVPGTAITISAGADSNLDIYGHMVVQGTDKAPVYFTGAEETDDYWKGIGVFEQGSVKISYARIEWAGWGVYFNGATKDTPGSVIDHCHIQACSNGVMLDIYDAPTFSLTNTVIIESEFAGVALAWLGRTAVTVQGNLIFDTTDGSGILIFGGNHDTSILGNALAGNQTYGLEVLEGGCNLQVKNNYIWENGLGIGLNQGRPSANGNGDDTKNGWWWGDAGGGAVIHSNVIANNQLDGIAGFQSIGHSIAYNVIADNNTGVHLENSWNALLAVNSIGTSALDGSLFNTGMMDLPFGFNADLAIILGVDPSSAQLDPNDEAGIHLENSYPGMGAEPIEYQWIEVNRQNADNWGESVDDDVLDEAAIGFGFPITCTASGLAEVYTHFQANSNGVVELVSEQGATSDRDDACGRSGYVRQYEESTFLFVNHQDWWDWAGELVTPTETFNNEPVQMNGWGYKHFNKGDVDGNGNAVTEECLVFRWYTNSYAERELEIYETPFWNDFQAVIYPDGRIRWNTRTMDARFVDTGPYCGVYAGANPLPVEIAGGFAHGAGDSALFNPAKARETTTQIVGNIMEGNGEAGGGGKGPGDFGALSLEEAYYTVIRSNQISSEDDGIQLFGAADLHSIILCNNMLAVEPWVPEKQNINWDSISNFAPGTAIAEYNYWNTNDPDGYVVGDVDIEPWLDDPVSSTVEVGALLYQPFMVDSEGGVITLTDRLYPGLSLFIPPGALDDPQYMPRKVQLPTGTLITMGDLLPVPALPEYIEGVGIPFVFTKNGLVFNLPVTITIPWQGFVPPTDVYYYDPATGQWLTDGITFISVDETNRTITFTTTHFTIFAAGVKPAPGAPGDDADPGPWKYHTRDAGDDHLIPCFVGTLAGNGPISLMPMVLTLFLGLALQRRKNR